MTATFLTSTTGLAIYIASWLLMGNNIALLGTWTASHGDAILAELITGNLTLNQTVAIEQC